MQGIHPMFAHHDLAGRWVNELDRITDGWLPGVFASAKSFIALTDLDVSWSEHSGAIAQKEARLARCVCSTTCRSTACGKVPMKAA